MRQVLLFRDEDGGWVVECPSLPGCISRGDSREEAIANIKDAIELYLDALRDEGRPIPEERYESYLVAV